MENQQQQKAFYGLLAIALVGMLGAGAAMAGAQGVAFGLFAALTLGGALVCLWEKSVVRSAFAPMGTFVGCAGFFLLLGADFLAMVQILLYVGGILALLLFGVMLTPPDPHERKLPRVFGAIAFVTLTFGWIAMKIQSTVTWAKADELPEIGTKAEVQVTDEEVQRALQERMQQFPGQERQVLEYYQQNPQAVASLRAPIFEDKVVDYILELATVNNVPTSKEELLKGADDDEHDHHHHDHDHDHDHHHHDH